MMTANLVLDTKNEFVVRAQSYGNGAIGVVKVSDLTISSQYPDQIRALAAALIDAATQAEATASLAVAS